MAKRIKRRAKFGDGNLFVPSAERPAIGSTPEGARAARQLAKDAAERHKQRKANAAQNQ